MRSANNKRFQAFGGFFAAGLLTFLFLSAVTWFLAGSKTYREAKFNAHQVLTTEVKPDGKVDGDQAVAIVAGGGSLKQLAEGKEKLVTGGDEDTLAVIARVSGGATGFVGDLESWKASRYTYDKGQALAKAAQAMGAGISARGVKVILVPDGVMPQNAAWRKAVFKGLGKGGVVPAFSGTKSAKRTLADTGLTPQDYVIVTDSAGFAAIDDVGDWKFVVTGNSPDPLALIKRGALVASTPSDGLKDLVSTTATAADKNLQLAAELQEAAVDVTSWTDMLKLPGVAPAAASKPKPKPKPTPTPTPEAPVSPKPGGGTVAPVPKKNPATPAPKKEEPFEGAPKEEKPAPE